MKCSVCKEGEHTKCSCKSITTPIFTSTVAAETGVNNEITLHNIQDVFKELKKCLTSQVLQDIISNMNAISEAFKGDGAGLSGGIVVDMFLTKYLSKIIKSFEEYHIGEIDCKILNVPLSIKKIRGKSTIALDWSKNPENAKKRERFDTDIMVINLKTEQWWKKSPNGVTKEEDAAFYSTTINAGIYLVSHVYCKNSICLSSNNKTNSLINNKSLYKMLKESIRNNMVIEFPTDVPKCEFNILNAFEIKKTPC